MGPFIHSRKDFGQCTRFDFLHIAAMTYSEVRAEREKKLARVMAKSRGDTKSTPKQPASGRGKGKMAAATDDDLTKLMKERDNLRSALAMSERRVKSLEDANRDVAKRLDAAIGKVKALIAKD
jgi:hypothetical protein